MVRRIFVEKKKAFAVEADGLLTDLRQNLNLEKLTDVRILNRYDVEGIDGDVYEMAKNTIFAEPAVDQAYDETMPDPGDAVFLLWNFCPASMTSVPIRQYSASA